MSESKRILVLCTGNSCRSQMAEGFLKSFDTELEVHSAGTNPAPQTNPNAMAVMEDIGIDISASRPKDVNGFLGESFFAVITVCGDADRTCPSFQGEVRHRVHIGFDDPADATGTKEEVLGVFRRVRDEIRQGFRSFYEKSIKGVA